MTWLRNSILSVTFVNPFTAEQKSENKHDKTRTGNLYMLIFRFGITVVSQRRVYVQFKPYPNRGKQDNTNSADTVFSFYLVI